MERNTSSEEEIDLGMIFNGFRKSYHRFLVSLYRGAQYAIRWWFIVLGIIILGIILGFLLQKENTNRETTLLVQLNFGSTYYVYNAIDQLNSKLAENDVPYLKKTRILKNNSRLINRVKIEPVVNIKDIFSPDKELSYPDINYLKALFDNSNLEGDLLTSELLISQYKTHKITLRSSVKNSEAAINTLLTYLNDNSLLQDIKKVGIKNTKTQIREKKESILAIDSISKSYGQINESGSQAQSMYFNFHELNNDNIHLMFEQKSKLLKETENLEMELLKYDHIVKLLNKPKLHPTKTGIFNHKIIIYPILFLIGFIVFVQIKRIYLKARRLSIEKE